MRLRDIADILIKIGYATKKANNWDHSDHIARCILVGNYWVDCDPFADTLEGRRQADVLEDYLKRYHEGLWKNSNTWEGVQRVILQGSRQWRLDRIKWCLDKIDLTQKINMDNRTPKGV